MTFTVLQMTEWITCAWLGEQRDPVRWKRVDEMEVVR